MKHKASLATIMTVISLAAIQPLAAQAPGSGSKPNATVSLAAAVEKIVPGKPFQVALTFELAEDWHIYWQNPGQAGMPPRVAWQLPSGFQAGHLQFPVPQRHLDPGNIPTNILTDEPVLLVSIIPPADLTGGPVALKGELVYLLCRQTENNETAKVELKVPLDLTLPVANAGGEATPANKELFEAAQSSMPETSSQHLSIKPSLSATTLTPGKTIELKLAVNIRRGLHIQSNKPTMEGFIASDVFLNRVDGLTFGIAVYPKAKLREVKYLGKLSEFEKRIEIRIPITVDEKASSKAPLRIGGIFQYQACNEAGTCFPPAALAFGVEAQAASVAPAISTEPVEVAIETDDPPPADEPTDQIEPDVAATQVVDAEQEDEVAATMAASTTTVPPGTQGWFEEFLAKMGLPGLLAACFFYGLVINLTPCVLPLLSIKVLGFVQQARESRRRTMLLGLAFGGGVMVFFVALGLLAASGGNILQYPLANIALGSVVMALALSMLGVYTLQVPTTATKLDAQLQQEGLVASFGKGALAPVLGFACTGPFMAFAFGWAANQDPGLAIVAFVLMGLGMASPYMLLGANPNWLSFLPKPGNWMITFERVMGFLLIGMVFWLLHPLVVQIGTTGLEWTLGFLVAVALACWLLGQIQMTMSTAKRWQFRGGAMAIVVISFGLIYGWIYPLSEAEGDTYAYGGADAWQKHVPWKPWSVEEAVKSGSTVFLDFTAGYCTVCKKNKAVAINTPEVREKMKAYGIVPMRGDYSKKNPAITAILKKHGRAGVPLNILYPAGKPGQAIVLTPDLSKAYLLAKLEEAGPSKGYPRPDETELAEATK